MKCRNLLFGGPSSTPATLTFFIQLKRAIAIMTAAVTSSNEFVRLKKVTGLLRTIFSILHCCPQICLPHPKGVFS